MWISKKKYNELLEKQNNLEQVCNGWKAKYEAVKEDKVTYIDGAVVISTKMLNELVSPNIEMIIPYGTKIIYHGGNGWEDCKCYCGHYNKEDDTYNIYHSWDLSHVPSDEIEVCEW